MADEIDLIYQARHLASLGLDKTYDELLYALSDALETAEAALKAIFLDPLGSHGARAIAREALGIEHIPFATPEEMLARSLDSGDGA